MLSQHRRQMEMALEYVGAGAVTRVFAPAGMPADGWLWQIEVEGQFFDAAFGTVGQMLALDDRYKSVPHVIETTWGDPVCCN